MQHTLPNLKETVYRNMIKWLNNSITISFKNLLFLALPKELQLRILRIVFIELIKNTKSLRLNAHILKYLSSILTPHELKTILHNNLEIETHFDEAHVDINLSLFDNLRNLLVSYIVQISNEEQLPKIFELSEIELEQAKPTHNPHLKNLVFKTMIKEYPDLEQIVEQHNQVLAINQN